MTPTDREAAADAILETVDLEPLGRALADLLWDAWQAEQAAEGVAS